MSHAYDILWLTNKGPQWIETASDLETAKARVQERVKDHPGRYLIFNQMTQEKVLIDSESKS
jgi:hypothetical protein